MTYTSHQKSDIDAIIPVFKDYLDSSDNCDLLWSQKLGYIFISIDTKDQSIQSDPVIITEPADLVREVFCEMVLDELMRLHLGDDLTPADHDIVMAKLEPYLEELPQYRDLAESAIQSNTSAKN